MIKTHIFLALLALSLAASGCAADTDEEIAEETGEITDETEEALGATRRYETEKGWATVSGAQKRVSDNQASGGKAMLMTTNGIMVVNYDVAKTRKKRFFIGVRGTRCDGAAAKVDLVVVRPNGTRDAVQASGLTAPADGSYPQVDMGVIKVYKGKGQLAVRFPNDKDNDAKNCDRNLYVDYVASRDLD